jgi:hypothetical protein
MLSRIAWSLAALMVVALAAIAAALQIRPGLADHERLRMPAADSLAANRLTVTFLGVSSAAGRGGSPNRFEFEANAPGEYGREALRGGVVRTQLLRVVR